MFSDLSTGHTKSLSLSLSLSWKCIQLNYVKEQKHIFLFFLVGYSFSPIWKYLCKLSSDPLNNYIHVTNRQKI
jgi:hypothetical protein